MYATIDKENDGKQFNLGTIYITNGISAAISKDFRASLRFQECLRRHAHGDFGDLCDEDRQMNIDAIDAEKKGLPTDRIFSAYETIFGRIYIITEEDRTVTTLLFADEY